MHQLNNHEPNAQQTADTVGDSIDFSPRRFLIITIGGIFLAELIAMLLIANLQDWPYFIQAILDATIMVVLIFPIVYFFSLRPLLLHIQKRHQAEEQLRELALFPELNPNPVLQVDAGGSIKKSNPAARQMNLDLDAQLFELIPDLKGLDLHACIATGDIQSIDESHFGDRFLQWTVQGAPEFGLAFLYSTDITERKRSQETVLLLSSVVSQTADTVVVTDYDGTIRYVNPAFERLTGYSKEDAIGLTPRVLKSGIHDQEFYKTLWDTVLNGQVFHGEISNRKKNGEIFHEVKTITPLRNEQGEIVRFVATGKDITERRQAQEKLQKAYMELELRVQERTEQLSIANFELEDEINVRRRAEMALQELNEKLQLQTVELEMQADELKSQREELVVANENLRVSQERLSRAQEIAHLGSWELDLQTDQLTWSDEVYRIFGLQAQEFGATYKAFLEAVHPEDRDAVNDAYTGSIRDGRDTYEIEHRLVRHSNGEIRIVHEKCEHFRNEAGDIVRSVGMVHDITGRKKAEDALQRFQLLSEHSRDIMLFIRYQDGHILEANAAAMQAYGYSHDELLALTISDLRGASTNNLTAEQMAQANERGILFETVHCRKDGSNFPVEVSSQGATIGGVGTLISIIRDIAARKQVEQALWQSREDLDRAQTVGQIGWWRLDVRQNVLTWSDENHRIFGITKGTPLTYETFLGRVHPDEREYVNTRWQASLAGEPYDLEHRIVADGKVKWVREKAYLEFDGEGQLLGGFGITQDITARKQAEAELERTRNTLAEAQKIAHLGSFEYLTATQETLWSEEEYRIYGLDPGGPSPAYDVMLARCIHPEDAPLLHETFTKAMQSGSIYEFEHRIVRPDGSMRWVYDRALPYFDEHRDLLRYVGATLDITERKRAEDALRESEAKYRNLFENMSEEVHFWQLVRDDAGHIKTWRLVDANPPTLKSWGKTSVDEIRGKTTDEIFGPGARDHYFPVVQKIMTEGVSHSYEDYFPNLDRYFRFTSVPLVDHFITTGADITSIKKVEQALRAAHDELEVRVQMRTAELAAANLELSNEIAERREVERQLRIQTAAMDAAANGILITDLNGIMLWTNPAITQISGYAMDELIGQSTRLFNSGKNEGDFYAQMWGTILAGNVWHGETTNRRRSGNVYVEEQTITPVLNEDGFISHFIAIKQDVTERKMMYAQLEASNQELTTLSESERQQRFLAEGLVESSVVLNMSLELHAVLDRIFEQTRRIIPYSTADIVLIEDHVATIVRQWWSDEYSEARTIFENDMLKIHDFPIWERICTTKSAVMVPDTGSESEWNTYFGMNWVRSYLGAPLIYNDQIIGIINLISDQANAFQKNMLKTLQAFAAPAAVAIQNARLYQNEQQNRKIAEILSAASVALAQTLDTQMVMETILDYMQFAMPLDVAFVVLNEGDERYRIRAVRTAKEDPIMRETLQDQTIDMLSEPIIRSYFTKYESTFIPDSREFPLWNLPPELTSMNCWLGIPLESMGKILGIVVIAHATRNIFTPHQIQLAEAVVKQAVVALQNAWLFEQVRSGRERLQQLSRHLVEIQENERKYIARELHDETSQSLTSLKMGLQVIEKEADRRVRLAGQVRNLQALADETLESLHHLAVNLRPASLDHLGLVEALTSLIESTKQRSGLQAHFKVIGSVELACLTEEMETSIYRIVQESITNVIRHAQATYVDVILEWRSEKILIVIEDDGVGIDMQKARETGHLGLIGMQERAEMLGGKLLVDSTPQVGTTLVVEIPYAN